MVSIYGKKNEVEEFIKSNSIDESKVKINIKQSSIPSLIALICGLIGSYLIGVINQVLDNRIVSNIAGLVIAFVLWRIVLLIYNKNSTRGV